MTSNNKIGSCNSSRAGTSEWFDVNFDGVEASIVVFTFRAAWGQRR